MFNLEFDILIVFRYTYRLNTTGGYATYNFTFPSGSGQGNYSGTGTLVPLLGTLLSYNGSGRFLFSFGKDIYEFQ